MSSSLNNVLHVSPSEISSSAWLFPNLALRSPKCFKASQVLFNALSFKLGMKLCCTFCILSCMIQVSAGKTRLPQQLLMKAGSFCKSSKICFFFLSSFFFFGINCFQSLILQMMQTRCLTKPWSKVLSRKLLILLPNQQQKPHVDLTESFTC